MKIWQGGSIASFCLAETAYCQIAQSVQNLRNNIRINEANIAYANFDLFYNIVWDSMSDADREHFDGNRKQTKKTKKSKKFKFNKALFAGSFFQSLWYFERKKYVESYNIILDSYCDYKYSDDMNDFAKQFMDAISAQGKLNRIINCL